MSGVPQPKTRECRICRTHRDYPELFHRNSKGPDGRDGRCKLCVREISQKRWRSERSKGPSLRSQFRAEQASIAREAARVEAANERAFAELRANTEDAIARRAS